MMRLANGQIRFLALAWLTPEPISFWKATSYSPWRIQILGPENREREGRAKKEATESVSKEHGYSSLVMKAPRLRVQGAGDDQVKGKVLKVKSNGAAGQRWR